MNHEARKVLLATELMKGVRTYDQLAEICDLRKTTVARWIRTMRASNLVHVSAWSEDSRGRMFIPCFAWGPGADAARPGTRLTSAQRMAETRAKKNLSITKERSTR